MEKKVSLKQDSNNFFRAVESRCSSTEYSMWLESLERCNRCLQVEDGVLQLASNSPTRLSRIEKQYKDLLLAIATEQMPQVKSIEFICKQEDSGENKSKTATAGLHSEAGDSGRPTPLAVKSIDIPAQQSVDKVFKKSWTSPHHSVMLEKHNFNNFVECEENSLAFNFGLKVTTQFSKNSPLYFFGPVGVGKTHLLYSVMQQVQEKFPFYRTRYMTPHHFVAEFTAALKAKKDREFRTYYHSLDLLIIDDVQFFMGKEKTAIEFFHLFNTIYAPGKQMLIASDRKPSELGGLDDRLKSRLSSSVVVEMRKPRRESRRKILSFYVKSLGLELSSEVFSCIVDGIDGDVRKIVGFVRTLAAYREVRGSSWRLSISECKELLARLCVHEKRPISPAQVVKSVQHYFSVVPSAFNGNGKGKFISNARQIAGYLLKKHTHLTMLEIGRMIGNRSPSTVVYGIEKVSKNLEKREVQLAISEIERSFVELD